MHLNLDKTITLAHLTASAFDVEAKATRFITASTRFLPSSSLFSTPKASFSFWPSMTLLKLSLLTLIDLRSDAERATARSLVRAV